MAPQRTASRKASSRDGVVEVVEAGTGQGGRLQDRRPRFDLPDDGQVVVEAVVLAADRRELEEMLAGIGQLVVGGGRGHDIGHDPGAVPDPHQLAHLRDDGDGPRSCRRHPGRRSRPPLTGPRVRESQTSTD